jgi:hypothetical protein
MQVQEEMQKTLRFQRRKPLIRNQEIAKFCGLQKINLAGFLLAQLEVVQAWKRADIFIWCNSQLRWCDLAMLAFPHLERQQIQHKHRVSVRT